MASMVRVRAYGVCMASMVRARAHARTRYSGIFTQQKRKYVFHTQ